MKINEIKSVSIRTCGTHHSVYRYFKIKDHVYVFTSNQKMILSRIMGDAHNMIFWVSPVDHCAACKHSLRVISSKHCRGLSHETI